MRSIADRIRHDISFEVLGLLLVTPLGALLFHQGVESMGTVALLGASIATGWNFAYNYLFDIVLKRRRGTTEKPGSIRILHAILFEAGLLLALLPFIAWYLGVSLATAFLMDASFAVFYMAYGYLFNLAYDRLFPLPEWKAPRPAV